MMYLRMAENWGRGGIVTDFLTPNLKKNYLITTQAMLCLGTWLVSYFIGNGCGNISCINFIT
jgi:hypothetical protein